MEVLVLDIPWLVMLETFPVAPDMSTSKMATWTLVTGFSDETSQFLICQLSSSLSTLEFTKEHCVKFDYQSTGVEYIL